MKDQQKSPAQRAWITRKRNAALGLTKPTKTPKIKGNRGIKMQKVTFKKLDSSNFHEICINSPCKVYIHKTLSAVYVSPNKTEV